MQAKAGAGRQAPPPLVVCGVANCAPRGAARPTTALPESAARTAAKSPEAAPLVCICYWLEAGATASVLGTHYSHSTTGPASASHKRQRGARLAHAGPPAAQRIAAIWEFFLQFSLCAMLRWAMVFLAVQFALALEGAASAFCSQMAAGLVARRVDVCQHGGHLPVPWG
jgi:hypothetical protein